MEVVSLAQARRFLAARPVRARLFDRPRFVAELLCLEPGQQERRLIQDSADELYLVLDGRARLRAGIQTQELGALEALVVPPGIERSLTNAGPGQLSVLVVLAPNPTRVALPSGRRPPPRAVAPRPAREEGAAEWRPPPRPRRGPGEVAGARRGEAGRPIGPRRAPGAPARGGGAARGPAGPWRAPRRPPGAGGERPGGRPEGRRPARPRSGPWTPGNVRSEQQEDVRGEQQEDVRSEQQRERGGARVSGRGEGQRPGSRSGSRTPRGARGEPQEDARGEPQREGQPEGRRPAGPRRGTRAGGYAGEPETGGRGAGRRPTAARRVPRAPASDRGEVKKDRSGRQGRGRSGPRPSAPR